MASGQLASNDVCVSCTCVFVTGPAGSSVCHTGSRSKFRAAPCSPHTAPRGSPTSNSGYLKDVFPKLYLAHCELEQDFENPSRRLKLCSLTNTSAALPAPSLWFTFTFSLNCLQRRCWIWKCLVHKARLWQKSWQQSETLFTFSCTFNRSSLYVNFDSAINLKLCS